MKDVVLSVILCGFYSLLVVNANYQIDQVLCVPTSAVDILLCDVKLSYGENVSGLYGGLR